MEYKVIYFERNSEAEAIERLNEKVTELLSDGWELHGGVSIIQDSSQFYHVYQAMTK